MLVDYDVFIIDTIGIPQIYSYADIACWGGFGNLGTQYMEPATLASQF
jgi:3-deoxy-D-manno-octulosonic-acid transferase